MIASCSTESETRGPGPQVQLTDGSPRRLCAGIVGWLEVSAKIQSGALSSEVTKAELDRIAALDPKLKS
jgi:hypothetical protein